MILGITCFVAGIVFTLLAIIAVAAPVLDREDVETSEDLMGDSPFVPINHYGGNTNELR